MSSQSDQIADESAVGGHLSFVQAVALVMGSIIGVGIFSLPTALAEFGPISLLAMLLTTLGALVLAALFGSLSKRIPADGGPYAFAREAFGGKTAFFSAWAYWITTWGGLAAIAVGFEQYLEVFVNKNGDHTAALVITLTALWVPAVINLWGLREMAVVQVATTAIKFGALAVVAAFGSLFIDVDNFSPANVSSVSDVSAVGGAIALCLFSYLGVEAASVAAAKVKDPERNVPRATFTATIAVAVVYMLSLVAVFGILGSEALSASRAPFVDAANEIAGGTWAGQLMAVAVIISGFGALNGWTLIAAEMPYAAAHDGLFPKRFAKVSGRGVPATSVVVSSALASIAVVVNYSVAGGEDVFTTLVFMTGITYAVPYVTSALAQIKLRRQDKAAGPTAHFVRDVVVAIITILFSILCVWFSRNTGEGKSLLVIWGPFLLAGAAMLLGVPVYAKVAAARARTGR